MRAVCSTHRAGDPRCCFQNDPSADRRHNEPLALLRRAADGFLSHQVYESHERLVSPKRGKVFLLHHQKNGGRFLWTEVEKILPSFLLFIITKCPRTANMKQKTALSSNIGRILEKDEMLNSSTTGTFLVWRRSAYSINPGSNGLNITSSRKNHKGN